MAATSGTLGISMADMPPDEEPFVRGMWVQ
jgi:hypothetical protein